MKKLLFIIFLIIFFLGSLNATLFAQEPEWLETIKKVKILKDNRTNIRSIFGKPSLVEEDRDIFALKEGKLSVTYSFGKCSPNDIWGKWKVSKDTVLDVGFQVRGKVEFDLLKLSLKGFKKEVPDDTPDLTLFYNERLGIQYIRFQKYLSVINISPSRSQNSLHCKD